MILLGSIVTYPDCADWSDHWGRLAEAPVRLALVLIVQQIAQLSDVAAAEAVRARLDWNYALAINRDDSGCNASALSAFRSRLLTAGTAEGAGMHCQAARKRIPATPWLATEVAPGRRSAGRPPARFGALTASGRRCSRPRRRTAGRRPARSDFNRGQQLERRFLTNQPGPAA